MYISGQTSNGWGTSHQTETFSALLALCAGNSPVTDEFPAWRPVTRSFGVFFDLCLNKRLSKQSWGWWFETPSHPLWRHCNETIKGRGEVPVNPMVFQSPFTDSKVYGANMGPTWVLSAPGGPHVGPMDLAIWLVLSLAFRWRRFAASGAQTRRRHTRRRRYLRRPWTRSCRSCTWEVVEGHSHHSTRTASWATCSLTL